MHPVIVVACGRSGTSLVTGSIVGSGQYWFGSAENRWGGDRFNPKGYFEDTSLVHLNEDLLATCMESPLVTLGRSHPDTAKAPIREHWLGLLDDANEPVVSPDLRARMEQYLAGCPKDRPFCLKDPQFSYTLSSWRPLLPRTVFVCVFRDPLSTADSIVRMCSQLDHLKPMGIDRDYGVRLWTCMYRRIVQRHAQQGSWLFLHARQVLDPEGQDRLEDHLDGPIDRHFGEARLMSRPRDLSGLRTDVVNLYEELCDLANLPEDS